MQLLIQAGVLVWGYGLGSIPFGLIFVELISGSGVREVASGRRRGANAARAGGADPGLLTVLMGADMPY